MKRIRASLRPKVSKKGLTPVIAVILLLMMTVAAAGAAFFWFVKVQSELQGGEEQYAQSLAERVAAKTEVVLVEYNRFSNYPTDTGNQTANNGTFGNLTFILKNTGNIPISVVNSSTSPKVTWQLLDADQKLICNEDWADSPSMCRSGCGSADIGVASTATIILNISGACDIGNYTEYPNDTSFHYKIDFAGATAAGGSFKK